MRHVFGCNATQFLTPKSFSLKPFRFLKFSSYHYYSFFSHQQTASNSHSLPMENQNQNPDDLSPSSKTAILDTPLHAAGFEIETLSPHRVSGRIVVSSKCCQPFKVLHGGVSAMIAEALASTGAQMASGFKRVAGFHLSIDHLQSAQIGELVLAEATPLSIGNAIQVWEVELWKAKSSSKDKRDLVASSRVTLLCNMPVPKHAQPLVDTLKRFSKL